MLKSTKVKRPGEATIEFVPNKGGIYCPGPEKYGRPRWAPNAAPRRIRLKEKESDFTDIVFKYPASVRSQLPAN